MGYWLCWAALATVSGIIAYQDLRTRLISLWLIVCFAALNAGQYLWLHSAYSLLENTVFCICYLLLCYLVLLLYSFVKHRRFTRVMDTAMGWGDACVALAIGVCIEPAYMIFFFTAALILGLPAQVLFFSRRQTVPLAGFLVVAYLLFSGLRMAGVF